MGHGEHTRPQGWFSRRHQTREAHDAAQQHYLERSLRRPEQVWEDDESRPESRPVKLLRADRGE